MPTLHLYLDEAGNWSFNPKGSKYFILTLAWTYDPQPLAHALTSLRFRLVSQGNNIESFHAAPDKQATRDAVVQTLVDHPGWSFAAIILEKRKVNPSLREPHKFYPTFATSLVRFVLRGRMWPDTSKVLVFADTLPIDTNARREGVIKAMKTACARELASGIEHHVFSHCRESNKWLQVADYCCWSVQRKWESNDPRTYNQLLPRLAATELDVTARGDQTMYY